MNHLGPNKADTAVGRFMPAADSNPINATASTGSVLYRPPAAATYVGLSQSTLAKMRMTGYGPKFIRLSPRAIGYYQSDLDAWLTERRCNSTSEYGHTAGSAPLK